MLLCLAANQRNMVLHYDTCFEQIVQDRGPDRESGRSKCSTDSRSRSIGVLNCSEFLCLNEDES